MVFLLPDRSSFYKKDEDKDEKLHIPKEPPLDTFDLQSEESVAQKSYWMGQGLKILTPAGILSRLPITLAHLQAGDNSRKLKDKIRKLLCSLYHSKNLAKTFYKNLINIIQKWKWSSWTLKIKRLITLTNFAIILLTSLVLKTEIWISRWLIQIFIKSGKHQIWL